MVANVSLVSAAQVLKMNLVRDITFLLENPHKPVDHDYLPPAAPRDESVVHISSAERCGRQIVYRLQNPGFDSKTTLPASIGTFIHRYIQNQLKELHGDDVEIEQSVDYRPKYPVIGSADIVTADTVYDIKTVGTPSWRYIPNSAHILQTLLYAWGLDKPYAIILYVNRGNLQTVAHRYKTHTRIMDIVAELERFTHLFRIAELSKPLPDRLPRGAWQCRYCPFAKQCWEGK